MQSDDDKTRAHTVLTGGTMVGRYEIVGKIGSGGMGEVYLALDTTLNRKVALKFLPSHLCEDEECRKRFTREAQAAAGLDHPNIAGIHEVGEYQGRPFFALQLVEGRSLREVIAGKDLPIETILEIGIQACEGLQAAHDRGIIHRDIKPSNILLDEKGRVRIVDFGLASVRGSEQLTKTGSTLGTIGYMSPEQVQGKEVDQRSDLFSLGVVLYEMLAKQNPFRRDSEAATIKAVHDDHPHPLTRYRSDLPHGLQAIVDKALDKNRDTRYQHADDMRADLLRILQEESASRTGSQATTQRKRHSFLTYSLALVALSLLGFVTAYLFITRDSPRKATPEIKKVTYTGDVWSGAISPDGTYYAYSRPFGDSGKVAVFVSDFSGQQAIKLLEGHRAQVMCWSPDGSELLIREVSGEDSERPDIYLVPRLGGRARKYEVPGTPGLSQDIAWMPDGERFISFANSERLILVDKNTGDTAVTPLSRSFQDIECGDVSHNGRFLVSIAQADSTSGVWMADIGSGKVWMIAEGFYSAPVWSSANDAVYAILNRWGPNSSQVVRIGVDSDNGDATGDTETLISGLPIGLGLSLPENGNKLLIREFRVTSNLAIADLQSESGHASGMTRQLTSGTGWIRGASISPDGKLVTYSAEKNNTFQLFVIPVTGGEPQQLTHAGWFVSPPKWSPDGKQIALYLADDPEDFTTFNMALVNADGSGLHKILDLSWKMAYMTDCFDWIFPDTIMISYGSHTAPTCVNPLTGDTSTFQCEKLHDKFAWCHMSNDGRNIAVSSGKEVLVYSFADSTLKSLAATDGYILGWSLDNKWVRILTNDRVVARINIESRQIDTLAVLSDSDYLMDGTSVAVSPDGTFLVYELSRVQRDLYLIENFDPQVK